MIKLKTMDKKELKDEIREFIKMYQVSSNDWLVDKEDVVVNLISYFVSQLTDEKVGMLRKRIDKARETLVKLFDNTNCDGECLEVMANELHEIETALSGEKGVSDE